MRLLSHLFAFILATCGASVVSAQTPTVSEIERKWRELETREPTEMGYSVTQDYSVSPTRPRRHFDWTVEAGNKEGKIFRGKDYLVCWNEKYSFVLQTKTGATEQILSEVALGGPKEVNTTYVLFTKSNMNGVLLRPWTFLVDDTVSSHLRSGALRITAVSVVRDVTIVAGTLNLTNPANVPLRYTFSAEVYPEDGRFRKMDLSLLDASGKTLGSMSRTYKYRVSPSGPQLERIDYKDDIVPDGSLVFTAPQPLKTEVETYRLSHYGFPEPEGVVWEKSWSTPLYVWLLAGAGCFATLALVFTWLRYRRRQVAPHAAPSPPNR